MRLLPNKQGQQRYTYIPHNFTGKQRNCVGQKFWARDFYVSTVGLDEEPIREYSKHQEKKSLLLNTILDLKNTVLGSELL